MNIKIISVSTTLFYLLFSFSTLFANQAVILTDAELDAIHAGGLDNLNFENFLGSRANTSSTSFNSASREKTLFNAQGVQFKSNPNLTITNLDPAQLTSHKTTSDNLPTTPTNTPINNILPSSENSTGANDPNIALTGVGLPSTPFEVQEQPIHTLSDSAQVNLPVMPEVSNNIGGEIGGNQNLNPQFQSSPSLVMTTSGVSPDVNSNAAPTVNNLAADNPGTQLASTSSQSEASRIVTASPSPISQNSIADTLAQSSSTNAVHDNKNQGVVMDLVLGNTGKAGKFEILGNSSNFDPTGKVPAPSDFLPGAPGGLEQNFASVKNGTLNIVDVGGQSQQFLTSFVNVNAAGSTVPVQVNLTVVINSTVENLHNSNSLNLSNFNTLHF